MLIVILPSIEKTTSSRIGDKIVILKNRRIGSPIVILIIKNAIKVKKPPRLLSKILKNNFNPRTQLQIELLFLQIDLFKEIDILYY